MTKAGKSLALFLFGAYFLPLAFQPVHVIWHHSCHYTHPRDKCTDHTETNAPGEELIASGETEICPICNYKFTVTNSPVNAAPACLNNYRVDYLPEPVIPKPYKNPYFVRSPRAPPAHSAS